MTYYGSKRAVGPKEKPTQSSRKQLIAATAAGVAAASATSLLITFLSEWREAPNIDYAVLESQVEQLEELRPLVRSVAQLNERVVELESAECPSCKVGTSRNALELVGKVLATIKKRGTGLNLEEVEAALREPEVNEFSSSDQERLRTLLNGFDELQQGGWPTEWQQRDQSKRLDLKEVRDALF